MMRPPGEGVQYTHWIYMTLRYGLIMEGHGPQGRFIPTDADGYVAHTDTMVLVEHTPTQSEFA